MVRVYYPTDRFAIHDNVADEIFDIDEKGAPVGADIIIIEDSEASYIKKKVQITNLPGGGGGEINTGSNVGTDGIGVFDGKVVFDLQFRHVAPASSKVTVVLNSADIDIDVVEANLALANLGSRAHGDLSDAPTGAHHPQLHASEHELLGGDLVDHDNLTNFDSNEHLLESAMDLGNLGTRDHASLSDAPSGAHHPQLHEAEHEPGGGDQMAVDEVAATGSLRTLGTGAQQAAVGNHTHAGGGADVKSGTVSLQCDGSQAVSFNTSFSGTPHVVVSEDDTNPDDHSHYVSSVSTTGFTANCLKEHGGASHAIVLHWIATDIGNP